MFVSELRQNQFGPSFHGTFWDALWDIKKDSFLS